jgi:RNA polymerase sigma-70 factor, ECF subfamily
VSRGTGSAGLEAAVMTALYDEHAAVLWRYAPRLAGGASQAEDVIQQTLREWQRPEVIGDAERPVRA